MEEASTFQIESVAFPPGQLIWTKSRYTEGKHGTLFRGKKDILTKLQRIVSNIGSRTSCTLVQLLLLQLVCYVLGYYYTSNIVLEESMMQVSFGLTTPPIQEFSFFS